MTHKTTHRIELIGDKDYIQSVCIDCQIESEEAEQEIVETQIDDQIELTYHGGHGKHE